MSSSERVRGQKKESIKDWFKKVIGKKKKKKKLSLPKILLNLTETV